MKTEDIFTCTILTPPKTGTENCLPIGTRLADFEITGIIGEGGFGIVYVAFDHSLQRTVAIKEYMPSTLAGRGEDGSIAARSQRQKETFNAGLRSFINEARLLAQFDHPSLVKVYRFWEENNTAYMAMRYYEGQTLKNIVKDNPKIVTEAWLRFIFKQILEALDALYKIKILHRDISPDNIIIQKNGSAVLLDFGAARQIIGDMTQGLTVILKPGYAPIEQYADDAAMTQGPWTDIYSVAAVMYLAVVKSPPATSVARMVNDPIAPLHTGDFPGFSAKFLEAIDKGMAVQPEARPQSITEFRKLLGIGTFASSGGGSGRRNSSRASDVEDTVISGRKKDAGAKNKSAAAESIATSPDAAKISRPVVAVIAGVVLAAGLGAYFYKSSGQKAAAIETPASAAAHASTQAVAAASASQPATVPDAEMAAWNRLVQIDKPSADQLAAFLHDFPSGKYAQVATAKLNELKAKAAPMQPVPDAPAEAAVAPQATIKPAEQAPATVNIKLAIKPWGTLFVDGKQKGVSPPLKKLILAEGRHKIKIVNPNFPEYSVEFDASKKNSSIEYDFSAVQKAPSLKTTR